MTTSDVRYWVGKARIANIRCIYKRWPNEVEAFRNKRKAYMEAARKAKQKQ